ncbi:MAG: TrkH family potassium uptake protein [Deinococcales bacterium]
MEKSPTYLKPAATILGSYIVVILMGTGLLMLPVSLNSGVKLRFLDALFTATSAVCITGLSVLDIANTFSTFGQVTLLILVFVGGIGIVTAALLAILATGQRLGVAHRQHINEFLGGNFASPQRVILSVLLYSVLVQVLGFFLLWALWFKQENAAYLAAFHSISAFNNAGFSLYPDSLARYLHDPLTTLAIIGLVQAGSIGFLLVFNLYQYSKDRQANPLTLSSKISLFSALVLLFIGTCVYLLLEWANPRTLGSLEPWQRFHAALFMAVTPRSAGLTNVDYTALSPASTFITLILMFVGASPVGTGGGIKTTTFFVLLLAAISFVRYGGEPSVFSRRISFTVVLKSLALAFFGVQVMGVAFTLLAITEAKQNMVYLVFEAVSAFATVGLSMNITPELSDIGRVIIISLMFLGRVGIITFALALTNPSNKRKIRYPEEEILVG